MSEQEITDKETKANSTSTIWMRNGLILIGIYAIIEAVAQLLPTMKILAEMQPYGIMHLGAGWALFGFFATPATLAFLGIYLIWNSHKITAYNYDDFETRTTWEPIAYKLAATFCGILILSLSLPMVGEFASSLAYWVFTDRSIHGLSCLISAIWISIQIGLGAYLIYGAPHIVRWQINRNPK